MSRSTVASVRREVARAIGGASPTAALDARVIVAHLVGCPPENLPLRDNDDADENLMAAATLLATRRAKGEPVARLIGENEFYGLRFALSPETLVPRPDTETLVDAAIAVVEEDWNRKATLDILDLGTGSGAILVALLSELPNCRGVGVDVSAGAIATARANAERNGVAARATFVVGNWSSEIRDRFHLVVANPPYIESSAIAGLAVEVRAHDPHLALDGGADGFDAIHAILADLGRVLADGGVALIEIGAGQSTTMKALAEAVGFSASFGKDLAGIDRVAVLERAGESEV